MIVTAAYVENWTSRSTSKRSIAFSKPDARDLDEIVERLTATVEAPREVLGQRQEHLDQFIARVVDRRAGA